MRLSHWQIAYERLLLFYRDGFGVAVTVFPAEIYRAPCSWGERAFGNLIYWNEVDRGGHFAA